MKTRLIEIKEKIFHPMRHYKKRKDKERKQQELQYEQQKEKYLAECRQAAKKIEEQLLSWGFEQNKNEFKPTRELTLQVSCPPEHGQTWMFYYGYARKPNGAFTKNYSDDVIHPQLISIYPEFIMITDILPGAVYKEHTLDILHTKIKLSQ